LYNRATQRSAFLQLLGNGQQAFQAALADGGSMMVSME
jgi:hypothetical protein